MIEQIINFECAKLAKEKGFNDIDTETYYKENGDTIHKLAALRIMADYDRKDKVFSAPTQSLLQKWIREIHFIDIIIFNDDGDLENDNMRYNYELRPITQSFKKKDNSEKSICGNYRYKTYEQTLEEGLFEALKCIKK